MKPQPQFALCYIYRNNSITLTAFDLYQDYDLYRDYLFVTFTFYFFCLRNFSFSDWQRPVFQLTTLHCPRPSFFAPRSTIYCYSGYLKHILSPRIQSIEVVLYCFISFNVYLLITFLRNSFITYTILSNDAIRQTYRDYLHRNNGWLLCRIVTFEFSKDN